MQVRICPLSHAKLSLKGVAAEGESIDACISINPYRLKISPMVSPDPTEDISPHEFEEKAMLRPLRFITRFQPLSRLSAKNGTRQLPKRHIFVLNAAAPRRDSLKDWLAAETEIEERAH